jgi:hypothetical protein
MVFVPGVRPLKNGTGETTSSKNKRPTDMWLRRWNFYFVSQNKMCKFAVLNIINGE